VVLDWNLIRHHLIDFNEADAAAGQRARRPKRCELAQNRILARLLGL
jgi:hypothetical protein